MLRDIRGAGPSNFPIKSDTENMVNIDWIASAMRVYFFLFRQCARGVVCRSASIWERGRRHGNLNVKLCSIGHGLQQPGQIRAWRESAIVDHKLTAFVAKLFAERLGAA
jgi:hypothetical protein